MENLYSNMHQKYSLSKTLRFELKPVGKTKENIERNGLLNQDEHRAKIYKNVKKYCDEYHKLFIDTCMNDFELDEKMLNEYYNLFKKENKSDTEKTKIKEIEGKLRISISNRFKNDKRYKGLFGKDIIIVYLMEMYKDDKDKISEISEFKKFTTYFSGFNTNRENMYVADEKSTAIAYRLINENLAIFINNVIAFNKVKQYIKENLITMEKELEEYLQVNNIEEVFKVNYFNDVLTQRGIEVYNILISGITKEDGTKIKGINEYINQFKQQHKEIKLPKLRQLYKQILSDKIGASFVIDSIENDKELIEGIQEYYENLLKILDKGLVKYIENIDSYDLDKIYLNNNLTLTQISKEIFGDWNKINELINENYDSNYIGKKQKGTSKYEEERKKELDKNKVYSISKLNNILKSNEIVTYLKQYIENNKIVENIIKKYEDCEELINRKYDENSKKIIKEEKNIEKIKDLLDSIKKLQEFIKILIPKDKMVEKDDIFYNSLEELYTELINIIPLYNKTRNYLTQKPYSTEKIKLNFDNDTFLDGWDVNKEKDNFGVLLIKDDKYYLGVMNPYNKKIFDIDSCDNEKDCYRKMEYKLLPGPNKMLPKVFFSNSRINEFKPSKELLDKYEKGYHKKGEDFDLNYCHELINFYRESLKKHEDWNNFNFKFKETDNYEDIGQFYKDVERQGYKITFKNYSEKYINSLVEIGDLYLFEIYNKDFSEYSKGTPNLHTLYWKALFSEENLKNVIYKLNGQAEMFYRKASLKLEDTAIHEKNKPVDNKNPLNKTKTSTFEYDLIKNKRYTVDKFQFHVPITINFNNEGKNILNSEVNQYLKYNDVNVIGIDRGERNLIYITVVNPKGEILEQKSLNIIENEFKEQKYQTDYHGLLDKKEKEREFARESWKTVENIKELKEGYLSQVVHKIVELMDQYKAIIVIEDLNNGFKNSRIKVEKQVYQKFEKMLIEKLNFLVYKNKAENEQGGLLNAYQLTNNFEGFNKLGKQSGILFYIPAWCTSKIDPTTGFVNLIKFKYESVEKAKEIIKKYDDIKFNDKENYFEFYMDYSKFTNKSYGIRKKWIVCSYGERIETFINQEKNNNYDTRKINLTDEFIKLFNQYNINLENIKKDILEQSEKNFWEKLIKLMRLMHQMRNSIPNQMEDYLISPVKNSKGNFYDSRKNIETLPKDADANGAYNIARKGLMLIDQIRESEEENLNKIKFKITNEDWLKYVQEKDI